jgi:hypothetical protein
MMTFISLSFTVHTLFYKLKIVLIGLMMHSFSALVVLISICTVARSADVVLRVDKLVDAVGVASSCTLDFINNEDCNLRSAVEYCVTNAPLFDVCSITLPVSAEIFINHSIGELALGPVAANIAIVGQGSTIAPSNPNNFTLPIDDCVNVTVEMLDIYGDGWQGKF